MKKSFKVLLLAVMALCLAAGAAFAELSSDVTFTVTSGDLSELSSDIDAVTGTLKLSADNDASISFDATIDGKTPYILLTLTSDDPLSIDIVSTDATEGVYIVPGSVVSKSISFDLTVISTEAQAVTLTVHLSDDTASGDATLKVYITATEAADTFDSASIDVYYVVDEKLASEAVSVTETASKTISVDLGSTVSFDVSASSSDLTSADGYTTSSDYVFVLTAPTTAGESVDVAFAFDDGEVVYTFKIVASGDSSGGGSSGGDDGTGEVTVDTKAEKALENLDTITAANITSEDIMAAFEELGIDGELTIDTSTSFTLFNLVDSNDKIVAVGIPALNAAIALLTSGNAGSETIDATTALNTVSASDLLGAITAFCADGWDTFVATVFKTSDMTEDNAKGIDDSAASETGEDGAYRSFGVALDNPLPTGTILLFTLIDTDTDTSSYYAMVLPGDVNSTVSVIPFNVANLRAFDGSSTLGTSAPTIATSTYKIAYSTLDGGGADFSSASVLAAIKAAAVETGAAAYVGEYALTSTSDSSGGEEEPTDQVSSHGSSSGCDAGFGALALLAVAGALAARKVRK